MKTKKLSEIKSETIKPHDIFQLMDLSRQLSVLKKPEVIDILKRLGINMVYKNYASKVENTLNPTMKAFERQHIETRSFLLDTELNYIFMIVNFQLNVMRRVIRIATLYMSYS